MSVEEKNIIADYRLQIFSKAKTCVDVSSLQFSWAVFVYLCPFIDFVLITPSLKLDELVHTELNLQPGTDPQIIGTVSTEAPFVTDEGEKGSQHQKHGKISCHLVAVAPTDPTMWSIIWANKSR